MSKCKHIAWLELVEGKAGPLLSYGSRLSQLTRELDNPSAQFPSIIFLIGGPLKDRALRHLCRSSYSHQYPKQGSINLRTDTRTKRSQYPRWFADCDPTCWQLQPLFERPPTCHRHEKIFVEWPSNEYEPYDIILARLLFLFTDVVCIFADDIGGLDAVRKLLSTWAFIGSASSLPQPIRPRVMVIVGGQTTSITQSVMDEEDFLFHVLEPDGPPLFAAFADIQTYRLPPPEDRSPDSSFVQLGKDISTQLHKSRLSRGDLQAMFSAIHLNSFFEDALHRTSTSPVSLFDFVVSSRQSNPLDRAFGSHVFTFVSAGARTRMPYDDLASHIASAILMDAYPPGMHGLLSPRHAMYRCTLT